MTVIKKSLGALTSEQLAQFLALLDQHDLNSAEFDSILKSPRISRLLSRKTTVFQWSWAYEFSMVEMLALTMVGVGEEGAIAEIAKAADPQEEMIAFAKSYEPDFSAGRPKASQLLFNIALMMATHHSLRSLKLYAKSMNTLIHLGRQGDDDGFVAAVRVDPSALSAPSLAKRVAVAQVNGESRFIKRIHKAAVDGPHAALRVHEKLRFSAVLLQEAGSFRVASREHIYKVLVEELELYEANKGDPLKGLFRSLELWRASVAT